MHLHLARANTSGFFSRRYRIDLQVHCSPADRATILAHDFSRQLIYVSPQARDLAARAVAAHQHSRALSVWNQDHQPTIIWDNVKSIALAARSRMAFAISVADLLAGTSITSGLQDVLAAERAITQAFDKLSALVTHAHTFDQGAETVLVPDAHADAPTTTPPSGWPALVR